MGKTIIEGSVLPDIDQQIEYIKHLRKDVIPFMKHLQTGVDMIMAIEQSLIAAKLLTRSPEKKKSEINLFAIPNNRTDNLCHQILTSLKIKPTSVRVDALKYILDNGNDGFTVSEIHKAISRAGLISKSAVISTIILFKTKGLIDEDKTIPPNTQKRLGRPEARFKIQEKYSAS